MVSRTAQRVVAPTVARAAPRVLAPAAPAPAPAPAVAPALRAAPPRMSASLLRHAASGPTASGGARREMSTWRQWLRDQAPVAPWAAAHAAAPARAAAAAALPEPPAAAAAARSAAAAPADPPYDPAKPWFVNHPHAESDWRATDAMGIAIQPVQARSLHRSDDEHPSRKFEHGEPPRGTNFDALAHGYSESARTGDDAFRGNTIAASWPGDGGGAEGPLHHQGAYLHVIENAYAVNAGPMRRGDVSVNEQEQLTHAVHPDRFVASLHKESGEIFINPNQTPERAAYHRQRLTQLHQHYQRWAP